MRFEILKFDCSEPASSLWNNQLFPKHVKGRVPSKPKKGIHVERKGYTVNVIFSCTLPEAGLHNAFLRLSQREVFMLALLFKREMSDEEFFAALKKEEYRMTSDPLCHRSVDFR